MKYLLDSDALIAAKSLYYKPAYCAGFWDWLGHCQNHGNVTSIDKVRDELLKGDPADHLVTWAQRKNNEEFFESSAGCMQQFSALSEWTYKRQPEYKPEARNKFLRAESADIWLVAFAANSPGKYTIVTNETSEPASRKSIKLPDAAAHFRVPTLNMFDLLDLFAQDTFSFRP